MATTILRGTARRARCRLISRMRTCLPAAVLLAAVLSSTAFAVSVTVRVTDTGGADIAARLQVRDGSGTWYPSGPDSSLLSHNDYWMGTFFYPPPGPLTMNLAPGTLTIVATKGFEYPPVKIRPTVQHDTSFVLVMNPNFEMQSRGWVGGDTHTHSNHVPPDYPNVTRQQVARVCQSEDLGMQWILDNDLNFIGGPDPLSTPHNVFYYTTEWRNQAFGHAAILGLKQLIGNNCCTPPAAAYPMLSMTRDSWNPQWDEAMSLNHPCSGAGFFDDSGWPAWGLGREGPYMAVAGKLDEYDIASYSNVGDICLQDWYGFLNCGLHVPCSAGMDAMMDDYYCRPPGGYRVYVKEDGTHTPGSWVQGLKAGRVFVTNFPLIPIFEVNNEPAGSVIDLEGPSATLSVHVRIESALRVSTAKVIVNGQQAVTYNMPPNPLGTIWESTFPVTIDRSSWVAIKVEGTTDQRTASSSNLFAHTGAVYVRLDQQEATSTVDAGRFADWMDSLQTFVEARGNWPSQGARLAVLARIDTARTAYGTHFHLPPNGFALVTPEDGDTLVVSQPLRFDWEDATDPEAGDRMMYQISFCADTTFSSGLTPPPMLRSEWSTPQLMLPPNCLYYWRVHAIDRGGNRTCSAPATRWFYLRSNNPTSDEPTVFAGDARLVLWPNPSSGKVWFGLDRPVSGPLVWSICDAQGRRVLRLDGRRVDGTGTVLWNGCDGRGRPMPSGLYWIRPESVTGTAGNDLSGRVLLLR